MQPTVGYPHVPLDPRLLREDGRRAEQARPFRAGARGRGLLLVALLTALALPSIANLSFGVHLGMLSGDLKVFQAAVVALSLALLAWHRSLRNLPVLNGLLGLLWIVVLFNAGSALVSGPQLLPPLARGIANLSINVLAAVGVSQVLRRPGSTTTLAAAVCAFGILVAASAVFEYVLLKTSFGLLVDWRNFVWGSVDPSELLKIGGVTLDPTGLARVGGIIGAPENLGYVLGLTLPFVMLLELDPAPQGALLVLYTGAAVVTGSRTLTIAIGIFVLLGLRRRGGMRRRARTAIVATVALALAGLAWSSVNEEAFARFSPEALRYEFLWRSDRLAALLAAAMARPYGWLTGIGFGSGADLQLGLESVTSGMLGGDVAVAFGLGGLVGLMVLGGFWTVLLTLRRRVRSAPVRLRLAVDMYVAFVGAASLLFPVLLQLLLTTGIICGLMVTFLVAADGARGDRPAA